MPFNSLNSRFEILLNNQEKIYNEITENKKWEEKIYNEIAENKKWEEKIYNEIIENKKWEEKIYNEITEIKRRENTIQRIASENNWADVYNSTIEGCDWLRHRKFSPGRWALGYSSLYVLFRVLDDVRPKNILDIGLGQSTWMISQYAAVDSKVNHTIVEHDPAWIEFFTRDHLLPENSKIIQLALNMTEFKGAVVREYNSFKETFMDQKFDMISIDGPFGGDMMNYARIDVLKMIPGILEENFIILLDDTERSGEKNTINEMKAALTENNINYASGVYSGMKDMTVLCSESLKFLTTM